MYYYYFIIDSSMQYNYMRLTYIIDIIVMIRGVIRERWRGEDNNRTY